MHSPRDGHQLHIQPWPDAAIDGRGHLPTSAYFEWLWLPRLGPSTAWAFRRLNEGLAAAPDGYVINLGTLAAWLGIGGTGDHSPLLRSLHRLRRFHLALQIDDATLAVRRRVPPLTLSQLWELDPTLQHMHDQLADIARPAPSRRAATGP